MPRSRCYETNVLGGKLILSNLEKHHTQSYTGCMKNASLKADFSTCCCRSSWGCSMPASRSPFIPGRPLSKGASWEAVRAGVMAECFKMVVLHIEILYNHMQISYLNPRLCFCTSGHLMENGLLNHM